MKYVFHSQRGDTLVEVVMALAILGVMLTAAFNIANLSYRVGTSSRERTTAINLAQKQAELLRQFRDDQVATAGTGFPIGISGFYMRPTSPIVTLVPGTDTSTSPYRVSITKDPSTPSAYGKTLDLQNFNIRVTWSPTIGDPTQDDFVNLKLTLANRSKFTPRQCDDATAPDCSNLVYP